MVGKEQIAAEIARLGIVIIIPTYNNEKTLCRIIDGVLSYTSAVIVVNDGSTDATREILAGYDLPYTLHLEQNSGKGMALRVGMQRARQLGFSYAITIDSDGQHYPDDIPVFVEEIAHRSEERRGGKGGRGEWWGYTYR